LLALLLTGSAFYAGEYNGMRRGRADQKRSDSVGEIAASLTSLKQCYANQAEAVELVCAGNFELCSSGTVLIPPPSSKCTYGRAFGARTITCKSKK
jgi:hypothetical protein